MTIKEEIDSLESQVRLLQRDLWMSSLLEIDNEDTQKKRKKCEELHTKLLRKKRIWRI